MSDENEPLYPLSHLGSNAWAHKSVEKIREALEQKPKVHFHKEEDEVTKARQNTTEIAV